MTIYKLRNSMLRASQLGLALALSTACSDADPTVTPGVQAGAGASASGGAAGDLASAAGTNQDSTAGTTSGGSAGQATSGAGQATTGGTTNGGSAGQSEAGSGAGEATTGGTMNGGGAGESAAGSGAGEATTGGTMSGGSAGDSVGGSAGSDNAAGDNAAGDNAAGDNAAGSDPGGGFVLPTEENSIAYLGCSMAWNIGNGYKRVGGSVMWNSDNYQTSAMVVQNWTDPNSASWNLFDQKMDSIGGIDTVKAIMIQICIFSSRATEEELQAMITSARQHVNPDTHIFMIGQPVYNEGHDCTLAGPGGADWTDEQAERLGNDPTVDDNISYLGQFILDNNAGEVSSDSCHASNSGEDALGRQAMEYFGG